MREIFKTRCYEWLLAAVIIARSSSYLFSKICLESFDTFTLLAIRFLLAFFLLLFLAARRLKTVSLTGACRGIILGILFFAVMSAELMGLRTTSSSVASFLENTAIVFVPLMEALLQKKAPKGSIIFCSLLTLSGIGLLTLKNGRFMPGSGELFCLLAAVMYALALIATDRFSHQEDPLMLGIFQVGTIGILGLTAAFLFETPHLPHTTLEWNRILYLAVVCTGFGFTLQPLAQSRASSEKAGMFCALNPLSASILGFLFLNERFSAADLTGILLILGSIIFYMKKTATYK